MPTTGERFERAVSIMARLRAPGGCPWDRQQTFDTIKRYTLEETYEVLEAIDNRDWSELPAELGDLMLQVLFYSEMAREQGTFSIDDVLERLSSKLVDRHPHVFGNVKAETPSEVLRNWEALKAEEKKKRADLQGLNPKQKSTLDGVSSAMPALLEAYKLSSKAANVGFDWPDTSSLFGKLEEEAAELKEQIAKIPNLPQRGHGIAGAQAQEISSELKEKVEDELGDLFFVLVNLARHLALDSESALKKTNRKFRRRFRWMEEQLLAEGKSPEGSTMDEMESLWQRSKRSEP